jgi:hypothetical protein
MTAPLMPPATRAATLRVVVPGPTTTLIGSAGLIW